MAGIVILDQDRLLRVTRQDIEEYAKHLGMNPDEDQDYLWIAKAGLKSVLPSPWLMCSDASVAVENGRAEVFFFNIATGENTWDHPCDERFRSLFLKEKARNEPRLVVTLNAAVAESGAVEVSATGMAGDTLARLALTSPQETLRGFTRRLRSVIGEKIHMTMPDGKVLAKADRETLVGELFGFEIPVDFNMCDDQGRSEANGGTWIPEEASIACAATASSVEMTRATRP